MGRILAIDYGRKRVGLAVSDTLNISANGLTTVEENKTIDFLKKYMTDNEVEKILIGYPTNFDGTDTHATPFILKFIKKLQYHFPALPIVQRDEAYTSKMAVDAMVQSGIKKSERRKKENIDKMSAILILQEYLQTL